MSDLNLFKRLRALEPDAPIFVGTVELDLGDGIARVHLEGGGYISAKNPLKLAVSKKVTVQGNQITGGAPNLPYFLIEI